MACRDIMVWVATDGSRAIIQVLPPGASKEDIELALAIKGVKNGIQWNEIDLAITRAKNTGQEQKNIIAAERTSYGAVWQLCGKNLQAAESDFIKECEAFRYTAHIIAREDTERAEPQGAFVEFGDVFLMIESPGTIINVFGHESPQQQLYLPKIDPATIRIRRRTNQISLVALCSGYIVIDSDDRLRIAKPIRVSEDNMTMHFIALPVSLGEQKLVDQLINNADANIKNHKLIPERDTIVRSLKEGRISKYVIKQGITPVPWRNGELSVKIGAQSAALPAPDNRINWKELSPFVEVAKGTIIAELVLTQKGTSGRDVYGNEIPVPDLESIDFTAGENVTTELLEGGRLLFISSIDGVALIGKRRVDVMPELVIKGDVGPETGNIRCQRSITIEGDVLGGYQVHCGGDLSIKGNVENSVRIECKGKLFIGCGVFGEKTRVFGYTDANIGFIQDSNVRVEGDVVIKKYVYNSMLTCGGFLHLEGQRVYGETRGAAIGGCVCSMKAMKIHSAGSTAVVTELTCGIDQEALDALETAKESEALAARRIVALQNSLGFDPFDSATIEKIKLLPQVRRDQLKKKILEMKETMQHRQKFLQKIEYFRSRSGSADLENASIEIEHFLVPDVYIRIGTASKMVNKPLKKTYLKSIDGIIGW